MRVDLSADVGEGADDLPLFPLLTSVSVACGAHAGDEPTMRACVAEARRLGVAVGAHPGYPDREHFGRAEMTMLSSDLIATIDEQVRALGRVCGEAGVPLRHVKPHGALYNQAAFDGSLAETIAEAVRRVDTDLVLVGLAGSVMLAVASDAGIRVAAEAFADRRYRADGTLASRGSPDALIDDPAAAAAQAVAIARGEPIRTVDGTSLAITAGTICLHSDTPGALDIAHAVRRGLESAGVEVAPLVPR
ncbi:MAG: 5-oxoprolinase subunit PxpA [Actinobacteria bacterium]|nr:MAG: 5-oxoprolinase subunit PxpA [Actinomycetota bacterium]